MKLKDKVLKSIWKEDEEYIYIVANSFYRKNSKDIEDFQKDYDYQNKISFVLLSKNEKAYVEWIPIYGPLTYIEESLDEGDENRVEDYIFDFCKGRGCWGQSICDGMNEAYVKAEFEYIFNKMKSFF